MLIIMDKFEQSKQYHSASAQYFRWYQVYEIPFTKARIENQKDILADTVEVSSGAGTLKGKEGLEERLKMYDGWQNAHHVQNTSVQLAEDGVINLDADILYQNIRPDGSRYSYTIHYTTKLLKRENELPLFTSVNIVSTGNVDNPGFQPAYIDNRVKSFMHYWLYLMETPLTSLHQFKELLADDFQLSMSTAAVNTWQGFEEWLTAIPKRIKQSAHREKNFSAKENPDATITVSVDFEWEGISVDDRELLAETHHEWMLENNPDERFARMKQMTVTQIIPFTVK
jgi:hypothetical protein